MRVSAGAIKTFGAKYSTHNLKKPRPMSVPQLFLDRLQEKIDTLEKIRATRGEKDPWYVRIKQWIAADRLAFTYMLSVESSAEHLESLKAYIAFLQSENNRLKAELDLYHGVTARVGSSLDDVITQADIAIQQYP